MNINSLDDVWEQVLTIIKTELTGTTVNTWFSECRPVEIDGLDFILQTRSAFKRDMLMNRYYEMIVSALKEIFSTEFKLRILTEDEAQSYMEHKADNSDGQEFVGYTFQNFVVGNSNKFAYNAAYAVAHNLGSSYNPLFIYGASGLGKTHLLYAIGNYIRDDHPDLKIIYIKGDDFMNDTMKSIKDNTRDVFHEKYRDADLFLVDDIHFIAGKDATQEEFFHTFNSIYQAGHQIVLTSDRPPAKMTLLDDRLRTRFEQGLMADIKAPDFETRAVIIRAKAASLGLQLSDEVVNYIAEKIETNVRQLEGVINRLTAYKSILGARINRDTVDSAIADIVRTGTIVPTAEDIIEETGRFFSISPKDIRGDSRTKNIAAARNIAIYIIREQTYMPLVDIGKEFNGRNHATVINSIKTIEKQLVSDSSLSGIINDIRCNVQTRITDRANHGK